MFACTRGEPRSKSGDTASTAVTTICELVWMLRNLDVATYRTGDPIPEVQNPRDWVKLMTGAWG